MQDAFNATPNEKSPAQKQRLKVLANKLTFDEKKYEYKEDFVPADPKNPMDVHTTPELVKCLEQNKGVTIDARVLHVKDGVRGYKRMNKEQFIEATKQRDSKRLRESLNDCFNMDDGGYTAGGIGKDFTPLLGGPFNKQLYYRDYLRMIATSFFAFHHDPAARAVAGIMTDFTLGRGFKVKSKGKDAEMAQAIWDAFSIVNDIPGQMDYCGLEISIYGETMWWWLPDNQTRISYNPRPGEKVPRGAIPRVRLIDPSNIAEIVTVPEDPIKGILYYVWLAPTQYQMYTDGKQPTNKFIYQQIPADEIAHYKVNSVSNEKRGRSDYFPALGYMKRLRDSVNYSLVAQQKAAAWSIDTTIKGDDADIEAYMQDQKQLGTIPNAGSEFVHTEAITREYLSNSATGKSADSPVFAWCMSMTCMATGIPLQYFGTHLGNTGTRASALVSTEPVAKKFERRRGVHTRMVQDMYSKLMRKFNLNSDCDVLWPELVTQDRSSILKDLTTAQTNNWLSHETCATRAAKEFDLHDFDYSSEMVDIKKQDEELGITPEATSPLTSPAKNGDNNKSNSSMPGSEKQQVKNNMGQL